MSHLIDTGEVKIFYEGYSIKNSNQYREAMNHICKKNSIVKLFELLINCIALDQIENVKMIQLQNYNLTLRRMQSLKRLMDNRKCEHIQKLKFINIGYSKFTKKQLISFISQPFERYVAFFM